MGLAKLLANHLKSINMSFLGLRTTIYYVSDLDAAKAWYSDLLGLEPYFDEPFYVGFNVGGYELGLHPGEPNTRQKGGAQTYWGVEDVQAIYDRMLEKGAVSAEEPNNVGGEIVVAAVYDPWDNLVGIIYNPEFKLPE